MLFKKNQRVKLGLAVIGTPNIVFGTYRIIILNPTLGFRKNIED
jgi:hypothetical protein